MLSRKDLSAHAYSAHNQFLLRAERSHWNLESDIAWDTIEIPLAWERPELLEKLRRAALIEAYIPATIARELPKVLDDPLATLVLSVEMFEGTRHFYALKRYLDAVSYEPGLSEQELVRVRLAHPQPTAQQDYFVTWLVNFMGSEHFAAYFFLRLAEQAREPILRRLLSFMGRDEVRHAQGAFRVLETRLAADPNLKDEVLRAALTFRHYGLDVVDEVPVAVQNDIEALTAFWRRVRRLCGEGITDYLRRQ